MLTSSERNCGKQRKFVSKEQQAVAVMGKGWQWPGDCAESFKAPKELCGPHSLATECEKWLELVDIPQEGQLKNNPNWEYFLSEGCFNITKMPNVSKALGGDIRMEKQDIGYDKQENKELIYGVGSRNHLSKIQNGGNRAEQW